MEGIKKTKVAILWNPRAGARKREDQVNSLVEGLRSLGFEPKSFPNRDEFREAVRQPGTELDHAAVVAAGGDGTLSWVINSQTEIPVAVLPLGTENLVARSLALPKNPLELAKIIAANRTKTLDLGVVNGQLFSVMASIGFDAAVVDRLSRNRIGNITYLAYAQAISELAIRHHFPKIRVKVEEDGSTYDVAHAMVFNLPEYAFRLGVCPEAVGDDGCLDMVLFPDPGMIPLFRYAWTLWWQRRNSLPSVIHRRVQRVCLESSEPAPIQADGDPMGTLPAQISLAKQRLAFFVGSRAARS